MIHRRGKADSLAMSFALVAALLLGLATRASAQTIERNRWTYDGGFLQRTRVWTEQTGQAQNTFVECTRNPQYVELYDGTRAYYLRLYNDKALIRGRNGRASVLEVDHLHGFARRGVVSIGLPIRSVSHGLHAKRPRRSRLPGERPRHSQTGGPRGVGM
jgi:hypothetical protein